MPSDAPSAAPSAAPSTLPLSAAPVLVLAAMAEEAAPLVARLDGARELPTPFPGTERPVTAVRGALAGRDTIVVTCGIGIAAATAATTWGVLAHAPAAVISAGSAGGLAADIEVGTLVVGEAFRYSIADATAFGYAAGQVPGQPEAFAADPALLSLAREAAGPGARVGEMLSGDAFVTAPLAAPMRERFPEALTADMETTAIVQTCTALGVPVAVLRAVSDLCGPAADQQFHLEIEVAAETSAAAVERLIAAL